MKDGSLREKGKTRSRVYELAPLSVLQRSYSLGGSPQLAEDQVWRHDIEATLGPLPENVRDIWAYAFTEMFNNAVEHSSGSSVLVHIEKTAGATQMIVVDDGIGIFRKIQQAMNLEDERHALLELTKGKLTTDPAHHSGEGIFFTSRVVDGFQIMSNDIYFSHRFGDKEDWLDSSIKPTSGTAIFMQLWNHTARTTTKVFDQYTTGADNYGFNKTVVPVRLAQYGNDKLISRSQAKRVLARVELFTAVLLDFTEVTTIGQAFADEVFRVFASQHPGIEIHPIHATDEVRQMISRVLSSSDEDRGAKPLSSGH